MRRWYAAFLVLLLLCVSCFQRSTLPDPLTDDEFWRLSEALSEPAGTFTLSDNFVSNEPRLSENARWLSAAGGVYVGVGPEQNFTYITRLRPAMAFIVDVRRENRNLHLLYKALFELANDRVEFVSLLFSRPRPSDLRSTATAGEIFSRFEAVRPSEQDLGTGIQRVGDRMTSRRLPLTDDDSAGIERALRAFYSAGPAIHFWGSRTVGAEAIRPSYRQLMTSVDINGQNRSYLATEEGFRYLKQLHERNLIVPVVGDFGGPDTFRRLAEYLRQHGAVVHAFYGSNVGVYLTNEQTRAFCRNLAALPISPGAWFIESNAVRPVESRLEACIAEPK